MDDEIKHGDLNNETEEITDTAPDKTDTAVTADTTDTTDKTEKTDKTKEENTCEPSNKIGKENTKKRFRKRYILFGVLGILLCIAIYISCVFFFYEPEISDDGDAIPFDTEEKEEEIVYETDYFKPGETPKSDKSFNFLVMARDKVSGLTDVIMLVNYNITKQNISIMQIPRDTYVEIENYYYHKINGAYSYFLSKDSGEADQEAYARRAFASYLERNLCIKIHFTVQMDIDGFGKIVDSIGGVDMYVPQDMYYVDPTQNLNINLKEGYQNLDGNKAEQFVRFRSGYSSGDIGRGDAQKLFMAAFIKKLISSISFSNLSTVTELASTVYDCVKTDMSLNDIIYFGKNLLGLSGSDAVSLSNITMMTLPGNGFSYELAYYSINKEATVYIINNYFNIYDFEITNSFDKNEALLYSDAPNGSDIYNKPMSEMNIAIYKGDQLNESGLN